jgi:hypothetical protein
VISSSSIPAALLRSSEQRGRSDQATVADSLSRLSSAEGGVGFRCDLGAGGNGRTKRCCTSIFHGGGGNRGGGFEKVWGRGFRDDWDRVRVRGGRLRDERRVGTGAPTRKRLIEHAKDWPPGKKGGSRVTHGAVRASFGCSTDQSKPCNAWRGSRFFRVQH